MFRCAAAFVVLTLSISAQAKSYYCTQLNHEIEVSFSLANSKIEVKDVKRKAFRFTAEIIDKENILGGFKTHYSSPEGRAVATFGLDQFNREFLKHIIVYAPINEIRLSTCSPK